MERWAVTVIARQRSSSSRVTSIPLPTATPLGRRAADGPVSTIRPRRTTQVGDGMEATGSSGCRAGMERGRTVLTMGTSTCGRREVRHRHATEWRVGVRPVALHSRWPPGRRRPSPSRNWPQRETGRRKLALWAGTGPRCETGRSTWQVRPSRQLLESAARLAQLGRGLATLRAASTN